MSYIFKKMYTNAIVLDFPQVRNKLSYINKNLWRGFVYINNNC